MTRLEIAEQKLKRLEQEYESASNAAFAHIRQANGQPMNDKRNGRSFLKKQDQCENRVFNKLHEIEAQKERIERLKEQEFRRENHLTANGGLQTSVHNLEEFKNRKQTADTKKKIKALEAIIAKAEQDKDVMSDKVKSLIADGSVTHWDKQPIYYFVKGLKKVALVINSEGEFAVSKKYPAQNSEDEKFLQNLLEREEAKN